MSWNSHVGQIVNLRPIDNRPVKECSELTGRLPIGRRIPSCPTQSPPAGTAPKLRPHPKMLRILWRASQPPTVEAGEHIQRLCAAQHQPSRLTLRRVRRFDLSQTDRPQAKSDDVG